MFIVKSHQSENGKIIVISDPELLGKRFEEKGLQLDLTKDFYKGVEKEEKEVKELIKEGHILHLTGKKTINFFTKLGLVEKEKILVVKQIPHAEVLVD